MGNYRFRLSDMMPNAWFYKLRDMSKVKNHPAKKNHYSSSSALNPRKSFHYTPDSIRKDNSLRHSPTNPMFSDIPFPYDPPGKSPSTKKPKRKTIYMPSPSKTGPPPASRSASSDDQDFLASPLELGRFDYSFDEVSGELSSSTADIVIDVDGFAEFEVVSEPDLPPILTKSRKESVELFPTEKVVKQNRRVAASGGGGRKSVCRQGGVRIRGNSRRKSVKREKNEQRFYSESFAIVKASFDPERDFRESMAEMIVENNITAAKDLEELLACYLSLNSNQYHDPIIKAFEQIWINMPQLHF